jgi:hypothetical protein
MVHGAHYQGTRNSNPPLGYREATLFLLAQESLYSTDLLQVQKLSTVEWYRRVFSLPPGAEQYAAFLQVQESLQPYSNYRRVYSLPPGIVEYTTFPDTGESTLYSLPPVTLKLKVLC